MNEPNEKISEKQIGQLLVEAGQAGDYKMVAICEMALWGEAETDVVPETMTQKDARAECERLIAECDQ